MTYAHRTAYQERTAREVRSARAIETARADEALREGRCPAFNCGAEWRTEDHRPGCRHAEYLGDQVNAELDRAAARIQREGDKK